MMKKIYFAIVCLIALSYSQLAYSATGMFDRFQYGLFGNYSIIKQEANYRNLPNVFSCSPGFTTGDGVGYNAGLLLDIPIGRYALIGLRGGYSFLHTQTSASETFPYQFGDNVLTGLISHHSEINLHNVTGEAFLGLRIFGNFILSGGALANLSFKPTFTQYEKLEKPTDFGAFPNGKRTRNEYYDYKLDDVSAPVLFAKAGLSYEILLNERGTVRLVPEFAYLHPINSLLTSIDWKLTGLSGGLAMKFSVKPKNPVFVDITTSNSITSSLSVSCDTSLHNVSPDIITLTSSVLAPAGVKYWKLTVLRNNELLTTKSDSSEVPETFTFHVSDLYSQDARYPVDYKLEVIDIEDQKAEKIGKIPLITNDRKFISNLSVYGLDARGNRVETTELNIERRFLSEVHPLLNYIFFEENKADIPARYSKIYDYQTKTYDVNRSRSEGVITIYRDILNILGQRMRNTPTSEISLKGFVSASSNESGNLELANSRANKIKDYLMQVWKIDPQRIHVELNVGTNGLPPKPSVVGEEQNFTQTNEENQRVEIYTKPEYAFLLDPVTTSDTVSYINPTRFVVKPNIEHSGQNYFWNLDLALNGKALHSFKSMKQDKDSILIDLRDKKSELIKNAGYLEYYFFAKDDKDLTCYREGDIKLKLSDADSSVSKYSLILFDFRSSSLGERNNQMIDLIRNAITDNSTIQVTGYTDILGDNNSNLILSKNRSLNAAKSIFDDASLNNDAIKNINNTSNNLVIDEKKYPSLSFNKDIKNVKLTVLGVGETEPLLYDNASPEGRFYSRTVTISVIKQNK